MMTMARLNPIPLKQRIAGNKKRRQKKEKLGPAVQAPRAPGLEYRNELLRLAKSLEEDINANIVPILKSFESEYVNDAYSTVLSNAFDDLRAKYSDLTVMKMVADKFVTNTNAANKDRFYKTFEKAVGVDLSSVIQNEGLDDILKAKTRENVGLIKSIPDEYFKKIETAVFEGTTQGNTAKSLTQQIKEIGKVTESRARTIARDQTSKLNSALNQQRQQNLGITEYVWRTAGDERVRESHASKNGRTYKWGEPPKDTGHPGQDINCRCVAQPVIKLD